MHVSMFEIQAILPWYMTAKAISSRISRAHTQLEYSQTDKHNKSFSYPAGNFEFYSKDNNTDVKIYCGKYSIYKVQHFPFIGWFLFFSFVCSLLICYICYKIVHNFHCHPPQQHTRININNFFRVWERDIRALFIAYLWKTEIQILPNFVMYKIIRPNAMNVCIHYTQRETQAHKLRKRVNKYFICSYFGSFFWFFFCVISCLLWQSQILYLCKSELNSILFREKERNNTHWNRFNLIMMVMIFYQEK